jgi:hypothetical protein
MNESHAERRRFKRIAFDARTEITQGHLTWPVKLVDLSLHGLLVQRPSPWLGDPSLPFIVHIHLSESVEVRMDAELRHDDNGQLGFVCLHIGLESIEHLRRLVELNLGDSQELERELGALIEV